MKRFLKTFSPAILLLISLHGLCADSSYICIRSSLYPDKPFHEFVFYKEGCYNPDQELEYSGLNTFVSKIALSEDKFNELKKLLFAEKPSPDSSKNSDPLYRSYYIAYIEGSKWLHIISLNNYTDYVKSSTFITNLFKGTKYEEDVKRRWIMIFDRLGIKPK